MIDSKILCPEYLTWIRQKPCLVMMECLGPVEADHLQARGTESHKQVDYFAIPLCHKHHRERQDHTIEWFQKNTPLTSGAKSRG